MVNGLDFLLAGTDPTAVIADVEADLGPVVVADLRRTLTTYDRIVGYLAEAKLAGVKVSIVHAMQFTLADGPVESLFDPLCLGPGDAERLAYLVRASTVRRQRSERSESIARSERIA